MSSEGLQVSTDSEYGVVGYDPEIDAVVLRWHQFAGGEEFHEHMDETIELLDERGTDRMLADSRELGAIDQEDQEWSIVDWAPRAQEAGLEHLALVYPESTIAQMSVDKVIEATAGDGINRTLSDDLEEVRDWLQSQ